MKKKLDKLHRKMFNGSIAMILEENKHHLAIFFAMYFFNEYGDRERAKNIEIYVEKNNSLAA